MKGALPRRGWGWGWSPQRNEELCVVKATRAAGHQAGPPQLGQVGTSLAWLWSAAVFFLDLSTGSYFVRLALIF